MEVTIAIDMAVAWLKQAIAAEAAQVPPPPLPPLPPPKPRTNDDDGFHDGALTIWGEARGEPPEGQLAVAYVLAKRARLARNWVLAHGRSHPLYGNGSVGGAARARGQFSCWSPDDVNCQKMLLLAPTDPGYCAAADALTAALNARVPDPSGGATHYHATSVHPPWADGRKPTARIGNHVFYDLGNG